jgi:hypothetical protein
MTFANTAALLLLSLPASAVPASHAQQPPAPPTQPPAGSNWQNVKVLPVRTRVHITLDHGGQTCRLFSVTDDAFTCEAAPGRAGRVIQRPEIKHIKLTHYGRSALVGAGVGGAIGAISGAIAGRAKPCPTGQTLCFNGIGVGAGGVAAIFGVGAGVVGSVVGGATDFTRGSSIYVRP